MKKLLCFTLSAVLAAALAVPAFADTSVPPDQCPPDQCHPEQHQSKGRDHRSVYDHPGLHRDHPRHGRADEKKPTPRRIKSPTKKISTSQLQMSA